MHKLRGGRDFSHGRELEHIRHNQSHGPHEKIRGNGGLVARLLFPSPQFPVAKTHEHHAAEHTNGDKPGFFGRLWHTVREEFSSGDAGSEAANRPGNRRLENGNERAGRYLLEIGKFASAMDIVAGLPIPPNDGFIRGMEGGGIIAGMESAEVRLLEMNIAALELVKEGLVSRRAGGALYSEFFMKIQGARSAAKSGLHPIVERIDSHVSGKDLLAVLPNVGEAELGAAIAAVEAVLAKLRGAKSGLNGNKPVQAQG